MGYKETLANILRGDSKVEQTEDTWTLLGDGAQSTVRLRRISRKGTEPIRVVLSVGPVFDGGISDTLLIYHYEFMRQEGGWLRRHYHHEKTGEYREPRTL